MAQEASISSGGNGSKGSKSNVNKLSGFSEDIAKAFGFDKNNPNDDLAKVAIDIADAISKEIDNRLSDHLKTYKHVKK